MGGPGKQRIVLAREDAEATTKATERKTQGHYRNDGQVVITSIVWFSSLVAMSSLALRRRRGRAERERERERESLFAPFRHPAHHFDNDPASCVLLLSS